MSISDSYIDFDEHFSVPGEISLVVDGVVVAPPKYYFNKYIRSRMSRYLLQSAKRFIQLSSKHQVVTSSIVRVS